MKPVFITPSIDSVIYLRGEEVKNKPVNLSLCTSIKKSKYSWYPDNEGLPCIEFNGCDAKWVYNEKSMRDADYDRIKNNEF